MTSPRSGRVRPESQAAAALLSVSVSSAAEGVFFSAVKDGGAEAFSYSGGVASLDGGLPIPARARLPHVGDRQSRRRKERRLVDGGLCGFCDFSRRAEFGRSGLRCRTEQCIRPRLIAFQRSAAYPPQASIAIGKQAGRNGSYANTSFDEKAPRPAPPACPGMDVGAQAGEGDSDAAAASTLTEPDSGSDGSPGKTDDLYGVVDGSADERLSDGSEGEVFLSLAPSFPIATEMAPRLRKRQPSPPNSAMTVRTSAPTNKKGGPWSVRPQQAPSMTCSSLSLYHYWSIPLYP